MITTAGFLLITPLVLAAHAFLGLPVPDLAEVAKVTATMMFAPVGLLILIRRDVLVDEQGVRNVGVLGWQGRLFAWQDFEMGRVSEGSCCRTYWLHSRSRAFHLTTHDVEQQEWLDALIRRRWTRPACDQTKWAYARTVSWTPTIHVFSPNGIWVYCGAPIDEFNKMDAEVGKALLDAKVEGWLGEYGTCETGPRLPKEYLERAQFHSWDAVTDATVWQQEVDRSDFTKLILTISGEEVMLNCRRKSFNGASSTEILAVIRACVPADQLFFIGEQGKPRSSQEWKARFQTLVIDKQEELRKLRREGRWFFGGGAVLAGCFGSLQMAIQLGVYLWLVQIIEYYQFRDLDTKRKQYEVWADECCEHHINSPRHLCGTPSNAASYVS